MKTEPKTIEDQAVELLNEYLYETTPCMEGVETAKEVLKFLEWAYSAITERPGYDTLYGGNRGVYYLVHASLEAANLVEHGSSPRVPWLTGRGSELLSKLQALQLESE